MWLSKLVEYIPNAQRRRRRNHPQVLRRGLRPGFEMLEDRQVPSNYTAGSVTQLIADINAANRGGGSNTITLVTGNTFTLTAVNNTTDGATGLPVIAANDNLTIQGNSNVIARSTASGTPDFRLFDVASSGSLTLENLTLQNGLAFGAGSAADGGAIFNQGSLDLIGVTVQNNIAQGQKGPIGQKAGPGQSAVGGGIYSNGTLQLEGGTIVHNNQAIGGQGGFNRNMFGVGGWNGGNGFGGGLYVAGGSATLTYSTVSSNNAQGGAYGLGTHIGPPSLGEGGGIYIVTSATVYLDAFTVANTVNNTASTSDPNIHGSYTLISGGLTSSRELTDTLFALLGDEATLGAHSTPLVVAVNAPSASVPLLPFDALLSMGAGSRTMAPSQDNGIPDPHLTSLS